MTVLDLVSALEKSAGYEDSQPVVISFSCHGYEHEAEIETVSLDEVNERLVLRLKNELAR